jgi:hypothetical protein
VSHTFRRLAESDALWGLLCEQLWADKLHVSRRPEFARKFAYYASLADSKRQYLTRSELQSLTFSFRFRESAGEDWISRDPWWRGEEARSVRFGNNRLLQILKRDTETETTTASSAITAQASSNPDVLDALPSEVTLRWSCGFWRYATTTGRRGSERFATVESRKRAATRHRDRLCARLEHFARDRMPRILSVRNQDRNVASLAAEAAASVTVASAASAASAVSAVSGAKSVVQARRSKRLAAITPPPAPSTTTHNTHTHTHAHTHNHHHHQVLGDGVRILVNNIQAPTYRLRRLPNWGLVLESCWAVYCSFPLPRRGECLGLEDGPGGLRMTTEEQDEEIGLYNLQLQLMHDDDDDDEED